MTPLDNFLYRNECASPQHAIEEGLRRLDRLIERLERRRGLSINEGLDTDDLIVEFAAQRERLVSRLEELQFALETMNVEAPIQPYPRLAQRG